MNVLTNFCKENDIHTDEFGRVIINDLDLLARINGALLLQPDFLVSDTACGNSNCVC